MEASEIFGIGHGSLIEHPGTTEAAESLFEAVSKAAIAAGLGAQAAQDHSGLVVSASTEAGGVAAHVALIGRTISVAPSGRRAERTAVPVVFDTFSRRFVGVDIDEHAEFDGRGRRPRRSAVAVVAEAMMKVLVDLSTKK
ncbi:MAG: hypothetical protein KC731_13300 [Myxococcales bacterium]|nr:hypothetical protein [Myxococcales bacterium]